MTGDLRAAVAALLLAAGVVAGTALAGGQLRTTGDVVVSPIRVGPRGAPPSEPGGATLRAPSRSSLRPAARGGPRPAPAPVGRSAARLPAPPAGPSVVPPGRPKERAVSVERAVRAGETDEYEDEHDAEPDGDAH